MKKLMVMFACVSTILCYMCASMINPIYPASEIAIHFLRLFSFICGMLAGISVGIFFGMWIMEGKSDE